MTHIKDLFVLIVLFSMILCMTACKGEKKSNLPKQATCSTEEDYIDMSEIYPKEFVIEEVSTLEKILDREYDLLDLKDFFGNRCLNSQIEKTGTTLYFDEVNDKYPVEVIRPQGYTVYKVTQGGYFYVFWAKSTANDEDGKKYHPVVYFAVYLSASKESKDFDSLKVGESTADDVRAIDEEAEFNFLLSRGTFSYSYLNEDEVMEIEYTISDKGLDSYNDLVIKDITIISRTKGSTCFRSILEKDLP